MSAKNEYEESVQIAPGRADAYHNVANAYIAMNQSDKAALYYLKAISLNPNMWQSHQNLGVIYYKKEEYEKARREILRAISLASDDSNLRSLLREIDIRLQHQ